MKEKEIEKKFEEIQKEINEDTISKEQIFAWFKEEIERKDKIIEELRKNNEILFNTAVRYNERELENLKINSDDEGSAENEKLSKEQDK